MRIAEDQAEKLFARAMAILDDHKPGFGEPILWHLAFRRYPWAMSELARRIDVPGRVADAWSASALNYRSWKAGNATAAHNEAMTCFNRRDLGGYRRWLRRAARAGDEEAGANLCRFEVRLDHGAAHDIGRGRPVQAHDGFWSMERVERRKSAMRGKLVR